MSCKDGNYAAPTYRARFMDERSTVSGTQYVEEEKKYPNCTSGVAWHPYYSYSSSYQVGKYTSMSDFITPCFGFRRANGEVIFNHMSKTEVEITDGSSYSHGIQRVTTPDCSSPNTYNRRFKFYNSGLSFGRMQAGFSYPVSANGLLTPRLGIIPDRVVSTAIHEASTSCQNKRGRSDSNLFETFAELDKSVGLLTGLLHDGLTVLNKNRSKFIRAKALGSAYLAYRYGLSPIMNDIEAVKKGMLKDVGKIRQTSRSTVSLDQSQGFSIPSSSAGTFNYSRDYFTRENLVVRAMSLDEYEATMLSNIGFTSKGLITLPWELLPYSFVVDWFTNIGDFIGAMTPTFGINQLGACYVVRRQMIIEYRDSGWSASNPSISTIQESPTPDSCNYIQTQTYRIPSLPAPRIIDRTNYRFSNVTRLADALALFVQRLDNPTRYYRLNKT